MASREELQELVKKWRERAAPDIKSRRTTPVTLAQRKCADELEADLATPEAAPSIGTLIGRMPTAAELGSDDNDEETVTPSGESQTSAPAICTHGRDSSSVCPHCMGINKTAAELLKRVPLTLEPDILAAQPQREARGADEIVEAVRVQVAEDFGEYAKYLKERGSEVFSAEQISAIAAAMSVLLTSVRSSTETFMGKFTLAAPKPLGEELTAARLDEAKWWHERMYVHWSGSERITTDAEGGLECCKRVDAIAQALREHLDK